MLARYQIVSGQSLLTRSKQMPMKVNDHVKKYAAVNANALRSRTRLLEFDENCTLDHLFLREGTADLMLLLRKSSQE